MNKRKSQGRNKTTHSSQQTGQSIRPARPVSQTTKLHIFLPIPKETLRNLENRYEIIISYRDPNIPTHLR